MREPTAERLAGNGLKYSRFHTTALYEDFTDLIAACGARGFVRKSRLARVDFGEFWPSV